MSLLGSAARRCPTPDGRNDGRPSRAHRGRRDTDAAVSRRLLLLEDDEALRRILAWEFTDLGYLVAPAGTCREARLAIAGQDIGLALLDVELPDGDGVALAGELSARHPGLRVLLCSGHHGAFSQRSIPPAVLACLTKPVSVRHLDSILRSLCCRTG